MKRIPHLRTLALTAILGLVLGVGACASAGSAAGGGRYLITSEEIMEHENTTADRLIRRLKPFWFQTRGLDNFGGAQGLLIVVDGTPRGGEEVLHSYQTHDLERIEYLNRRDATRLYGDRGGGGAIVLHTRGG